MQQGQSVFHNAEELEEFSGAIAEISERDRDFLVAAQTEERDDRIAKSGQVMRSTPLFHLAFVFAQGNVAHPVQAVLDAPVPTPMIE